jgi:hypothetical protein
MTGVNRTVAALALLVPLMALPACSSDPALKKPPVAGPTMSVNPVPQRDLVTDDVKKVVVTVKGGEVAGAPGPVNVALGGQISLTVTSDTADDVVVPAVGITVPLTPGKPTAVSFIANTAGPVEARLSKAGKTLARFEVH